MKPLLLLAIMTLVVVSGSAAARSVGGWTEGSVVIFEPKLYLASDDHRSCQGILLTEGEQPIVQTLPECVVLILNIIRKEQPVYLSRESQQRIAIVSELGPEYSRRGYLRAEVITEEALDYPNLPGSLVRYQSGPKAYYIDPFSDETLLIRSATIGERIEANGQFYYLMENDESIPPGAIVSKQGRLLCLASGFGRCLEVSGPD